MSNILNWFNEDILNAFYSSLGFGVAIRFFQPISMRLTKNLYLKYLVKYCVETVRHWT
jgi:hypothetical protein